MLSLGIDHKHCEVCDGVDMRCYDREVIHHHLVFHLNMSSFITYFRLSQGEWEASTKWISYAFHARDVVIKFKNVSGRIGICCLKLLSCEIKWLTIKGNGNGQWCGRTDSVALMEFGESL